MAGGFKLIKEEIPRACAFKEASRWSQVSARTGGIALGGLQALHFATAFTGSESKDAVAAEVWATIEWQVTYIQLYENILKRY